MTQKTRSSSPFIILPLLITALLCGCSSSKYTIADGTYRAEFDSFDQSGYKDFVEITFADGAVTEICADAVCEADGKLKSESETVRADMQPICGTYPEKYYRDLINQYLADPTADSIDIVAGATQATNDFILLVRALEEAVRRGETGTVIVPRK